MLDYVENMSIKTGIGKLEIIGYIGISRSKYYDWQKKRDKGFVERRKTPKNGQLLPEEKEYSNYF